MTSNSHEPTRAIPIAGLTFLCSLGTGVLWNALYFIAASEYGFTQRDNLVLALVNGILYTVVAVNAGRTLRFLENRMSPRSALGLVLLVQAVLAPLVLIQNVSLLWIAAVTMSALGALQWPIVQHYLASGRHGRNMRNAIGWWNASWMSATAIGLAAAGPLQHAGLTRWAIPALMPINLLALLFLARFPAHPPEHNTHANAHHVPRSYRSLLGGARVLHPMGYLVIGALSPILPYLFERLTIAPGLQAPIGATWHVARLCVVIVLWRTAFWHGRAASLVIAGLLLSVGFAACVAAPNEPTLVIGLIALGLGQGTIYYSAIYYGLAVGGAEVEAGGTHEALVGAGFFIGPALGLASLRPGTDPSVFIGLVLGALSVGFVVAVVRAARASSQSTA
jgi:MFS family permease